MESEKKFVSTTFLQEKPSKNVNVLSGDVGRYFRMRNEMQTGRTLYIIYEMEAAFWIFCKIVCVAPDPSVFHFSFHLETPVRGMGSENRDN